MSDLAAHNHNGDKTADDNDVPELVDVPAHPVDELQQHPETREEKLAIWNAMEAEIRSRLGAKANDNTSDDDSSDEEIVDDVDDLAVKFEQPKLEYVKADGTPDKSDPNADANTLVINYIKDGKLRYAKLVGVKTMDEKPGGPVVLPPAGGDAANGAQSTTAAPAQPDSAPTEQEAKAAAEAAEEKDVMEKLAKLKNVKVTHAFAKAATECSDCLRDMVENEKNPLYYADREITNRILAARQARKERVVDVTKEPLLMSRITKLTKKERAAKSGAVWSDIQILDLRNPEVAGAYDAQFIARYESLVPNNSAVRLIIVESKFKTETISAYVRLWCFFSVKEKNDKQTVEFQRKRAGIPKNEKKKAANAAKGKPTPQPLQGPICVERGPGKYLPNDAIIVLATFFDVPPVVKPSSERFQKIMGIKKAEFIDREIKAQHDAAKAAVMQEVAQREAAKLGSAAAVSSSSSSASATSSSAEEPQATQQQQQAAASPAAAAPEPGSVDELVQNYFKTGIKPTATKMTVADYIDSGKLQTGEPPASAVAQTAEEKKFEEEKANIAQVAADVKKELAQIAADYKAQCMALEVIVHDYMRRRFEARKKAVDRRKGTTEAFLMLTYGQHLVLRMYAARPHIPEPIALVIVTEHNGAVINMDESTCISQSQLETFVKGEAAESPTMDLYRALNLAFNSDKLNVRKQVVVLYIERGRYQDMGSNVRLMLFVDANYAEMEKVQNDILERQARERPGQPSSIAQLLQARLRADTLVSQLVETPATAPAT